MPQDVKDVWGYVDRALYSLDNVVIACMTLPQTTLADYNNAMVAVRTWHAGDAATVDWLTSGLSALYREGQAHAATLRGWYQRLTAEGCTIPGGIPQPPTRKPFLSSDNPELLPPGLFGNIEGIGLVLLAFFFMKSRS